MKRYIVWAWNDPKTSTNNYQVSAFVFDDLDKAKQLIDTWCKNSGYAVYVICLAEVTDQWKPPVNAHEHQVISK